MFNLFPGCLFVETYGISLLLGFSNSNVVRLFHFRSSIGAALEVFSRSARLSIQLDESLAVQAWMWEKPTWSTLNRFCLKQVLPLGVSFTFIIQKAAFAFLICGSWRLQI